MSYNSHIDLSGLDKITLEILTNKFKGLISELDILKWLDNFEQYEIDAALRMLENLTVYTAFEVQECINNSFCELFEKEQESNLIIVIQVGDQGKSGSMMSYFFQKTQFFKNNKNKIKILPNFNELDEYVDFNTHIILIDDFVGSGKTIGTFFLKHVQQHRSKFKYISLICAAGMNHGIEYLKQYFNFIIIQPENKFDKAFHSKASFFGYRKYREYRNVAYKYGSLLTNPQNTKTGIEYFPNALGFNNSQALVSFQYGTPNNTLPIFWSSTNNWRPLIPRFYIDKLRINKDVRKRISHELAILKEFGSASIIKVFFTFEVKKSDKIFTSVDKIDFTLYSIIKLLREGFLEINICRKLGISMNDFNEMLKIGQERMLLNSDNKLLTPFGVKIYAEIKGIIYRYRKRLIDDQNRQQVNTSIQYTPKIFNGRS